jgi:hypothetical protein
VITLPAGRTRVRVELGDVPVNLRCSDKRTNAGASPHSDPHSDPLGYPQLLVCRVNRWRNGSATVAKGWFERKASAFNVKARLVVSGGDWEDLPPCFVEGGDEQAESEGTDSERRNAIEGSSGTGIPGAYGRA